MNNYAAVLPPTIASKKRDSERAMPIRKRTAPIDMRVHRSRMSQNIDPQELLVAQKELQTGVPAGTYIHRAMSPSPGDRTPRRLSFAGQQPQPPAFAGQVGTGPTTQQAPAPIQLPGPPPALPKPDNGFPQRPMFVEPPPETDEDISNGALSSSVIVIPPSPVDPVPAPTTPKPPAKAVEPEATPTQQNVQAAPAPVPTTLADTPATGEPIKDAAAAAGIDVETAAKPAPIPTASSPPPRATTSPPATSPPPSGRSTPTGSAGRRTPTGTMSARGTSPPARRPSDPPSRTPSISSSLRRESSLGGSTASPTTGTRPTGPRIIRGPRVAHRPTPSVSATAASGAGGSATSGGPPPGGPVSKVISPGLKRRPLSGIGFTARSMASESENETDH